GANYHVGVATSDIGTDLALGQPWGGGGAGSCDTFAGDDGALQVQACDSRTSNPNASSQFKSACAQLCPDDKFVPTDGNRFISSNDGLTNVPVDMEMDSSGKLVDQGPVRAFQCMALVGDYGCGVEGQLEGSKRALDQHSTENAGFLRPNSLL